MGVSIEARQENNIEQLEKEDGAGVDENEKKNREDASEKSCLESGSEESGEKSCSKRKSPFEEAERVTEEPAVKKRCVPEIELGIWPKLVHMPGTSSDNERQPRRYPATQQKMHRPWETRSERYSSYPIRPKASLPRNGFINEFGHLGFRDHWKQVLHTAEKFGNERSCAFGRHLGGGGENWMLSPAQFYASYFGHYGRSLMPMSRECISCLPSERQEFLMSGKRGLVGAVEKRMSVGAERFRLQYQQQENEAIKPKVRQSDEKGTQRKRGFVTYWPNMQSESGRLKGQRIASSSSPTFEYVSTADRAKETPDRPFNCTICEKSFKRRSSLATHKFIHTDLKPHVCGECNKRFLRKSDLKKHGLMHSGKKPYQCEKCGRRFSQSSNMLTHFRRHMGIRPFECNICTRSFFRKVDLKRHEGRHMAKTLKAKNETE